jgi:hypothetical protein
MAGALDSALVVIGIVPPSLVPVELAVTLDRGIELDWRNGTLELEIEILSDGSIEMIQSRDGNVANKRQMSKPDLSLLGEAFVWLEHG